MESNKAKLSQTTPQYSKLEYFLQISLKASTAKIQTAWIVSNPAWTLQFEKLSQDKVTVDAWIDCMSFFDITDEFECLQRLKSSSSFQASDVPVFVNKIPLESISHGSMENSKIIKTLVYGKVCLGKAYPVRSNKAATSPPPGFDSICLLDGSSESTYILKHQSQFLPLYVVTFQFDPVLEKRSRERPQCENCEKCFAAVYCPSDSAYLCKDCDVNLHSVSKVSQKHVRTPIGKGADSFGSCRTHNEKIEFFCSSCYMPICIHCKMIGHHSSGEASKHVLVKVTEAFEAVVTESKKPENSIHAYLSTLEQSLTNYSRGYSKVDEMQKALLNQLEKIYEEMKGKVHLLSEEKKIAILSEEIELRRQHTQIKTTEEFLVYQREAVDMFHLLYNWATHQALRDSLKEQFQPIEPLHLHTNLKIGGLLTITDSAPVSDAAPKQVDSIQRVDAKSPPIIRKTSDMFMETLQSLEGIDLERSSVVNKINFDEMQLLNKSYK